MTMANSVKEGVESTEAVESTFSEVKDEVLSIWWLWIMSAGSIGASILAWYLDLLPIHVSYFGILGVVMFVFGIVRVWLRT
jgi:hypothetical protein